MKLQHFMSDSIHLTFDGKIQPYNFATQRKDVSMHQEVLLMASTVRQYEVRNLLHHCA